VNRDAKTQTALLALARSRRMQRAIAHAHIHRDAPLPTLRLSLGFMTSTAASTDVTDALGHRMRVLGIAEAEGVAYVVEEIDASEPPIVYRLFLRGARQGHLVPIHSWYEAAQTVTGLARGSSPAIGDEIRARIASIAATLEPATPSTTEAWMLSTRVVQRRALRVAGQVAPIRKFALQLFVEPVSSVGASGRTTVTAFLRPQATLLEVLAVPRSELAIARVSYIGIPSGLGQPKETVVLLTE
jgi:hypothetical protein